MPKLASCLILSFSLWIIIFTQVKILIVSYHHRSSYLCTNLMTILKVARLLKVFITS